MKVLIASEYIYSSNLYVYYHCLGLKNKIEVVNSIEAFWTSNLSFDIIHIHWPEFLVNEVINKPDYIQHIEERISYWQSKGAHIIITRHNYLPHYTDIYSPAIFKTIYDLFYSSVDAIVHHGYASLKEFEKHPVYGKKINIVINHPNYLINTPNQTTKEEARKRLNLEQDDAVFLSFGSIRTIEEQQMLIKGFKALNIPNKKIIIPNSLFLKWKPSIRKPISWLKYKLEAKKYQLQNIIFHNGKIDNEHIQYFMNAANVVISPRTETLNSGVIYLALSFGAVVVGPDTGNISEVLDKTGNPKFKPHDINSFTEALSKAYTLSKTDLGEQNLEYVKEECDVYKLGEEYINLYNKLIEQ